MKIGVVNDLALAVGAIRQVLAATDRHQVAWVAHDGAEAVALCAQDPPDLILMDLVMPVMDGVEATRCIMAATPCAILVVTATVDGNSPKVFEALGAGALDAIDTPVIGRTAEPIPTALLKKIDLLEKFIAHRRDEKSPVPAPAIVPVVAAGRNALVAIGASAGGPVALGTVLASLPANFPAAVVIIQHVDVRFARGLADWLGQQCSLPVRLAREGEKPAQGVVLLAGTADHLVLIDDHTLGYTAHPDDYVYRPSVDVFFESVVRHWRGKATGVLLTGMGRDGAHGLKMLRDARHHTIAQDRASSVVYGMPKEAATLNAAVEILPLDKIGPALKQLHPALSLQKAPVTP